MWFKELEEVFSIRTSQCAARTILLEEAALVQTYDAGGGSAGKYIRRGEDSIPIAT